MAGGVAASTSNIVREAHQLGLVGGEEAKGYMLWDLERTVGGSGFCYSWLKILGLGVRLHGVHLEGFARVPL